MVFKIILDQFLPNFEDWLNNINNFFDLTFIYLKYIFFLILLLVGLLTLLKLRGRYFFERIIYKKGQEPPDNPIAKPRIIIGTLYIIIAFGILFNWFIYLLIVLLNPLPDRFIFNLLPPFTESFNPFGLNTISDISLVQFKNPFEKTLYYGMGLLSFNSLINLTIGIWQIVTEGIKYAKTSLGMIIFGLILGLFSGFTTCLPLFL